MAEPTTLIGLGALMVTNTSAIILAALKERKRSKKESMNNKDLKEVKDIVEGINGKVNGIDKVIIKVKTCMEGMQGNCAKTTSRFEQAINDNRKEILDLSKRRRK